MTMKKLTIFYYHLGVFGVGSVGIVAYVFYKLSGTAGEAHVGGVIAMPVIAFVFVVGFGILCALSLAVFLAVSHIWKRL